MKRRRGQWPQSVWPVENIIFRHSCPAASSSELRSLVRLINNPEILLADEPTGALDSKTSAEIMGIFQQLNHTKHITIVLVTHSDEVAQYADRIIVFRDGCIVSDMPFGDRHIAVVAPSAANVPAEVLP